MSTREGMRKLEAAIEALGLSEIRPGTQGRAVRLADGTMFIHCRGIKGIEFTDDEPVKDIE